jgi:hypothetical protein
MPMTTRRPGSLAALLAALLAGVASAAPPELKTLFPPAVRRGVVSEIRLYGSEFAAGAELLTPFAGEVRLAVHSKEAATLTIKPDAVTRAGVYPVRVRTPEGVTNLRMLAVTEVAVVPVREPNGRYVDGKLDLGSAQRVQLPCAVCGHRLIREVDAYRFTARAGERVTIVSESWRMGLTPDLVLRLRDDRGRTLAYAHDTPTLQRDERIDCTIPRDGDYFLEITATEGGGRTNHYLVRMGAFDYARSVFPLGGRRGEPLRLSVVNRDGKTSTIDTRVPADPWHDHWQLPLPGLPGSLPWRLAIGDWPEVTEDADRTAPQAITWPATVNGRIARPGEEDLYRIAVKPGEHVRVQVEAYHLGSRLDGYLLVYDPKGKKLLAQNDDQGYRGLPDPGLTFETPAGVTEVVIALRDTREQGGHEYGYRLTIERGGPDFFLWLGNRQSPTNDMEGWLWQDTWDTLNLPVGQETKLRLTVRRSAKENDQHYNGPIQGYTGPIAIKAENVPPGVTVKPLLIPAGQTQGELVVVAGESAPARPFELVIVGEGKRPDGSTIRRIAERRLFLSDPAVTNMPWNARVNRLTCVTTRRAATAKP